MDPDKARLELARAYLHMYRCAEALRGKEVSPVDLDDSESIGEELFYLCKKVGIERSDPDGCSGISCSRDIDPVYVPKSEFVPGQDVWYMNGVPRHCVIESVEYSDETGWEVHLENGTVLKGFGGISCTRSALLDKLSEVVYGNGK